MTGCTKVDANKVALVIFRSLSVSLLWPVVILLDTVYEIPFAGDFGPRAWRLWSDSQCFFLICILLVPGVPVISP